MTYLEYGNPASDRVLIEPVDARELESIHLQLDAIRALAGEDFRLLAVKIDDWNLELSPWPAAPVFGKVPFGGGADKTLQGLLELCQEPSKRYLIGGYSLAGLFALWASGQTGVFSGVAAASPSVWFPGFSDYLRSQMPRARRIYLSLGDREEKTRNPLMACVADRIREIHALLQEQKIDCTLEWNPGNHFREPELRTAKAFAWLLRP